MKKLILVVLLVAATGPVVFTQSASPAAFQLAIDSVMRGPELVGNPPNNLRWSGDSKPLYWADEYKRILKLFETNLKK